MYEAAEVFGLAPGVERTEMHEMLQAKIIKGARPEARVFYTSQGKSTPFLPGHIFYLLPGCFSSWFFDFCLSVSSFGLSAFNNFEGANKTDITFTTAHRFCTCCTNKDPVGKI